MVAVGIIPVYLMARASAVARPGQDNLAEDAGKAHTTKQYA